MRDVARIAGVSPMTVSRALRDDGGVNRETLRKIQQTAADLGYVYDTTAQAFRTQKSGFVAVTLPSINNANFADTFRGMTSQLAEDDVQLLLGSTNYRVEKEEQLVHQLLKRNPEAIVLTGGNHTHVTQKLLAAQAMPVIEIWDLPEKPLGHAVGFSNAKAMETVVQHLAKSGRRKLAFVGAEEGADLRGAERRAGVVAAAERLGLPEVEQIIAGKAPVSMSNGAQAVRDFGKDIAQFDALVCVSDPVAFGVLSECRRLGISVPDDVAITGFGNFEVSLISDPRITTVDVNARQIGEKAAAILKDVFAGLDDPQIIDLGAQLVERETA